MSARSVLGRSVVIPAGAAPPEAWRDVPVVDVTTEVVTGGDGLAAIVDDLHRAWVRREPRVIRLGVADDVLACPQSTDRPPWELGGSFTFLTERLHFLVWANSYDARHEPAVWWWGRKAQRLGAEVGGPADVTLPDGRTAWIDGGPRQQVSGIEGAVIHAESIVLGRLDPVPETGRTAVEGLADDQAQAVLHTAGPARVIAPAGSGKTRTLIARLIHLLDDRAVEPDLITAVAYNRRAAMELDGRLGFRRRGLVRTIHSLGRAILHDARGELRLLDEREVRRVLDPIVPAARRPNTDVIGPYIEALSEVRIALRSPAEVEAERDDVPDFAQVFDRYRKRVADRDAADQDEYIFGAIVALLADPELRRRWQTTCRHLLVDEFQDLTPGYLLLLRLVASPALDVFAVGDDDQVIYGYAGADPGFLVDFDRLFPGAAHHALETNYRSPAAVVEAAGTLLGYNRRRVDKVIRSAAPPGDDDALRVVRVDGADTAAATASVISGWLDAGVSPSDMAVLCRVNAALLPVHAVLVDDGIALRSPIGPAILDRTVLAAALAWMRIGMDPSDIARADLMKAVRRPSRGLTGIANDVVGSRRRLSIETLREAGRMLDGRRKDRWADFRADIALVAKVCSSGDVAQVVDVLTHRVGLGRAAAAHRRRPKPGRSVWAVR